MKKRVFGRQFKRDVNERKALFRGLASELVMHERIVTTEEKAKAIRSRAEKLVTKAKNPDTAHAISLLQPFLSAEAVKKMLSDIAPRFSDRQGGYTRIIKLGRRFNDNASTVRMEWVSIASASYKADEKETSASTALSATIATEKPSAKQNTKKKAATKKSSVAKKTAKK